MPINRGFSSQNVKPAIKQNGAVIVLMMFLIGLAVSAYLIKSLNAASSQVRQDVKTYQALNNAKQSLISWAVSHKYYPGQMPWPDRNGDGNYDGSSDCVAGAGTFQYDYLLGQLPSIPTTSPCFDPNNGLFVYSGLSTYPGLGQSFQDAHGNHLWYAVSRNLVYDYEHSENPIINPGMLNASPAFTPYLRQGGTQSYPWLRVLDRNGHLVSDRVAAVIIAPGNPIGGQDRSALAPDASEFLDSFRIGAAIYSNRAYATANEDFVMGEDGRNVLASDTTFQKPYYFNDKLVFITIDELMAALEKRAANEVRVGLKKYYDNKGYFPYAAGLNLTTNPYQCVKGNLQGFLPIASASNYVCSCTDTKSCSCHFAGITSVKYTRSGAGVYGSSGAALPTGKCSVENSNKTCSCTGAGSCKSSTGLSTQFSCDACGNCSSTIAGNFSFKAKGGFSSFSGGCSSVSGDASCNGTSTGTFSVDSCDLADELNSIYSPPAWFTYNLWQDYIYYAAQRGLSPTLTAGGRSGIKALTITMGYPIITAPFASKGSAQIRPSCNLIDHMDTNINATGDVTNIYESLDKHRSQNYNDQIFVISP